MQSKFVFSSTLCLKVSQELFPFLAGENILVCLLVLFCTKKTLILFHINRIDMESQKKNRVEKKSKYKCLTVYTLHLCLSEIHLTQCVM